MNLNILRYSLFDIARGQEVDHTFIKSIIYPLTMIALLPIRVNLKSELLIIQAKARAGTRVRLKP